MFLGLVVLLYRGKQRDHQWIPNDFKSLMNVASWFIRSTSLEF